MKTVTSKYILVFIAVFSILTYFTLMNAPNQKFSTIESEFLDFYFQANPVTATWIGIHDYDSRLPDYSKKAIAKRLQALKLFEEKCDGLDNRELEGYREIDLRILRHAIQEERFNTEKLRSYVWNPLTYIGTLGFAYESIAGYDFAPANERLVNLIGRLQATPEFLKKAQTNLDSMPKPHMDTGIKQVQGIIGFVEGGFPEVASSGTDDQKALLIAGIADAKSALKEFKLFLENRFENGPYKSFRLGKELFDEKLIFTLNEGISAAEVLARAEAELKFVQGEMVTVAEPLYKKWFGETPDLMSHDAQLGMVRKVFDRISDDRAERDEVVENAEATIEELNTFIKNSDILTLDPTKPLELRETPEYQRGVSIASLQAPGPLENNLPTYYNVSPIPVDWDDEKAESFLREYNKISVKILSIHEALPGHYVQLYYANRHPSIIRSVFGSGVMVEGWAHYTEDMMIDEGFGGGDPQYKLVERKWKLRGIANAILDHKIHAGEMTEEEAMNLMVHETFQEEAEASAKWRRAQLSSGQLSTYFVGFSLMWDLRRDVEEMRGNDFTLKSFHEELLSHGSIPIRYLREAMLSN